MVILAIIYEGGTNLYVCRDDETAWLILKRWVWRYWEDVFGDKRPELEKVTRGDVYAYFKEHPQESFSTEDVDHPPLVPEDVERLFNV